MDLIREILLGIEADPRYNGMTIEDPSLLFGLTDRDPQETSYHLGLLIDAGYVKGKPTRMPGHYLVLGLTEKGHDYLDTIRDPEIWRQAKEGAHKAGGFTLDLLGDLAKGLIKTQIKKHTGVDL